MKRNIYTLFLSIIYYFMDFTIIVFAILFSYKAYRVLEIGKQVVYAKLHIIPVSLTCGLITLTILTVFGAYKKESSLLNVEEIKNVVKGVSFSFLIFMLILVFGKFQLSRYVLVFSYFSSMILVVIERTAFYHILPLTKGIKGFNKRILIYGAGELGQVLFRSIKEPRRLAYRYMVYNPLFIMHVLMQISGLRRYSIS